MKAKRFRPCVGSAKRTFFQFNILAGVKAAELHKMTSGIASGKPVPRSAAPIRYGMGRTHGTGAETKNRRALRRRIFSIDDLPVTGAAVIRVKNQIVQVAPGIYAVWHVASLLSKNYWTVYASRGEKAVEKTDGFLFFTVHRFGRICTHDLDRTEKNG